MAKLLITGASGFIGSFLVEAALKRGYEVYAGVRHTSSRKYLQDPTIKFLEIDFEDEAKLHSSLQEHTFDYVIHAAGVTAATNQAFASPGRHR